MKNEKLLFFEWYTEGPAFDSKGNLYFTTLNGGKIFKIDLNKNLSEWAYTGCPNGQIILENDIHLVCNGEYDASIYRLDDKGQILGKDIEKECAYEKVFCPNDIIYDNDGGFYFTDSVRYSGKVFYYSLDGYQRIIGENLDFPNGLALSNDGALLFIAESYNNRILVINLRNSGERMGKVEVFATLPINNFIEGGYNLPDGLKLDEKGNLFIAHYGMNSILKVNKNGEIVNKITTSLMLTSNLVLKNDKIIYTGGTGEPGPGGLYEITLS